MSAKVTLSIQDRATSVASMSGVSAGIVVDSEKGEANVARLITSQAKLIANNGAPNPKLGVSMYSAMNLLTQSNQVWVVRAANDASKFASALVRTKVDDLPLLANETVTDNHLAIKPLEGLTKAEFDAFQFPVYLTNKLYDEENITIQSYSGKRVLVNSFGDLNIGDHISFTRYLLEDLNSDEHDLGEATTTYRITDLTTEELSFDLVSLASAIDVTEGTEVLKSDGSSFVGNPRVARSAVGTKEILITTSDYIAHGETIKIGDITVTVESKRLHKELQKVITVDQKVIMEDAVSTKVSGSFTTNDDFRLVYIVQSEIEERDGFLVINKSIGTEEEISIETAPSVNFPDKAFLLRVYVKGVLAEEWEVARYNTLDGFNRQLEIEHKINGNSNYILVKNNQSNVKEDGTAELPLFTDTALWKQDPDDVFVSTGLVLTENLLKGHTEVKFNGSTTPIMGTRIKFATVNGLSKEYKIHSVNASEKTLILDRPVEENQISLVTTNENGSVTTEIMKFDPLFFDADANVWAGVKYYPIVKLGKTYPNYKVGAQLAISGVQGKLVDPGANLLSGAYKAPVTLADMIRALNLLKNKEKTPINLVLDGGYATPAYANAVVSLAEAHGATCHAFISVPLEAELSADPLAALTEYRNSLNLGTKWQGSGFTGWVKQFDEYSQTYVWTSPESYAAAAQSFTAREYAIFTPAAGWKRGVVTGLDVAAKFDEGERDYIVKTLRLNPIRYKEGSGLVIWGNETLLSRQSPLQLRSVAMLLILISNGLNSLLENFNFDFNDEGSWDKVQGAIDAFMRDDVKGKSGVYDYRVAVSEIITDTDIDNRRMPVFLGIKPTMDIQEIPVTIGIYNKAAEISVSA